MQYKVAKMELSFRPVSEKVSGYFPNLRFLKYCRMINNTKVS